MQNIESLFTNKEGVLSLDIQFDAKILFSELNEILQDHRAVDAWKTYSQLGLTYRKGIDQSLIFHDACGSLYDRESQTITNQTSEFTELSTNRSYLNFVISQICDLAKTYGRNVGRVRFMKQEPKTCLSLHKDLDEFRFHIPVQTSRASFFVVDDEVCRMPREGSTYILNTRVFHTAINASRASSRIHLLFDTY